MVDIVILGATGFTGKLVTRYLNYHRERNTFTFAIAGRSKSKLGQLIENLNITWGVPIFEVDVTNDDQIEEIVKKTKVVINTVGPYWRWGKPVVRSCARNGVHYVDICGETPFVQDIIAEYESIARESRAVIVPSCGFDSVPADISIYLAAKTLQEASSGTVSLASSESLYRARGGMSGGTASTSMYLLENIPTKELMKAALPYAISPLKGPPVPSETLVHKFPHIKSTKYGFLSPFAQHNRATVQRTWGLFQLYANNNKGDRDDEIIPYGDSFFYNEGLAAPGPISAFFLGLSVAFVGVSLIFFPPARWLFKKLAPKSGKGPSEEKLKGGFFVLRNISVSTPSPETRKYTVIDTLISGKGDPGYTFSSIAVSEAALSLLDRSKLTSMAQEGGILTPMSAFGNVLIERLKTSGQVQFESKVLEEA